MENFLQGLLSPGQTEEQNAFRQQIGMQLMQSRGSGLVGALSSLAGGLAVGQANKQGRKLEKEKKSEEDEFRKMLIESLSGKRVTEPVALMPDELFGGRRINQSLGIGNMLP